MTEIIVISPSGILAIIIPMQKTKLGPNSLPLTVSATKKASPSSIELIKINLIKHLIMILLIGKIQV